MMATTFESAALELADAMDAAIKRFETIQETHPDIQLDLDLVRYRTALFWFRKMPTPTRREQIWSNADD